LVQTLVAETGFLLISAKCFQTLNILILLWYYCFYVFSIDVFQCNACAFDTCK